MTPDERAYHRQLVQGSPEWFEAKLGKLTASRAATAMSGTDTKGFADLCKRIAWERVYGATEASYRNSDMDRGSELEPEAREWYSFETGRDVEVVGLIDHPTIPNVACSPDGLLPDRTVQIKAPLHGAFMEVKRTKKVPAEYRYQLAWEAWCCELTHCDFLCYHPSAGGVIVEYEPPGEVYEQMAERVELIERKVAGWIDILRGE